MEKGTISELVHTHIENTSAHGLPNMLRAKTFLGKLIWFLLFVAGIGALTWQIADRLDRYFSNEYDVKLEINFSKEVPFPAVTFCNMNPLRTSALRSSRFGELADILKAFKVPPEGAGAPQENTVFQNLNPKDVDNTTDDPESSDGPMNSTPAPPQDPPPDPLLPLGRKKRQLSMPMTPTQMPSEDMKTDGGMTTEGIESWENRARPEFFSQRNDEHVVRELMANQLSQLSVNERVLLGHQLETMLLDCEWQGYPCAPNNFTKFFNSQFGNCYTFGRNSSDLKANHPGPANGLSLEVFIEHEEYLGVLSDTAGIILVVHEPDKMPLPEDDGILISTGLNTAVGIKQLKISRLGQPYANCSSTDEILSLGSVPDYYRETFGVSYSLKTCERSCYQRAVIENCSCADSSYPSSKDEQIAPCKTEDDVLCKNAVELSYRAGDVVCDCFNPCEETVYIPSISVAYWPSAVVKQRIYDDIKRTNKEARSFLIREPDPSEWLEENVAKVRIYFQEFNYETITQSPAYSLGDLLSDVGGQLGLWLGISVLSMFEIVETISAVMAFLWHSLKNSGKVKKMPSTPIQELKPSIKPTMLENRETLFTTKDGGNI